MNTPTAPQKRGRKPKPAAEKPTQLTIRMPPKLKLGLELLARAQHRSLSQAVEWALNAGLSKFQLANDGYYSSLAALLDDLWDFSPPQRAATLLIHAPELLSYEDRIAAELVEYSVERQALEHGNPCEIGPVELDRLVEQNWDSILAVAASIISAGESPRDHSLLGLQSFGWVQSKTQN